MDGIELSRMGIDVARKDSLTLHRGQGCLKCRNTGYSGRSAIYEVMPYTESQKKLTTSETDVEKLRTRAREEGMFTLRESAIKKMLEGVTTYNEVLRVTWENY